MNKKLKPIPKFKSEDEERDFWAKAETTDYFDINKAEFVSFPNLKTTSEKITLEVSASILAEIKKLAKKKKVSYQTMMTNLLTEKVLEEYK